MLELPRVVVAGTPSAIGISRARVRTELRRGNWRELARGAVLTRPDDPTRADWADLGIALAGPSAALTGWDAVRAIGLGDRVPPDDRVVVLSRHASNRVIGQVRVRETNRPYSISTTSADAAYELTPIVPATRAVADACLAYRRAGPVRALVTSAVQRRRCAVANLIAELAACPRQHSALFRAALADAMDGARSAAECAASRRMTAARLPAFELNVPIMRHGVIVFVVDVLLRELRAVLEIDSREWHFSESDWKRTMRRHNMLTRHGLALTHYPPSVVSGRDTAWTGEVAEWLHDRARELGVPLPAGTGVRRPLDGDPVPYVIR